jgi:hypothetical protein
MRILQQRLTKINITLWSIIFASQSVIAITNDISDETAVMQLYSGEAVRKNRNVSNQLPNKSASALLWQQYKNKQTSGSWKALWDQDTSVPLRIYGSGLLAPNSVQSVDVAAIFAKDFLVQQIDLLAPGSKIQDFTLVSNEVHNGVRVVGFQQSFNNFDVQGGQLSFRFKHDRMVAVASEALPFVHVTDSGLASAHELESRALDWIMSSVDVNARKISSASEPFILPLVKAGGSIDYKLVRSVKVETDKPIGNWEVYINASSAEPIGRKQTLMFGTGTAYYNTPERWPGGGYLDYPAMNTNLVVNSVNNSTDSLGDFIWTGASTTSVETLITGPYVSVFNDAGTSATATFQISDGGSFTWSDPAVEFTDSQITSYIHANLIKEYVRPWNPGLAWLDQQLPVTVNINDTCNAFSDGNSINFLRESNMCSNTGRLVDIIYHEFGHSLHQQSIIGGVGSYDGPMGEGAGDFLAATVVNDSAMGVGYYLDNSPLREIDPVGTEAVYPDDLGGGIHIDGLIYAGAFWDLRKALIAKLGQSDGVAKTEQLFYATLQRAVDMPSSYVEVLIEDDDDGNLDNGTPNFCEIYQAFGIHGLTGVTNSPLFGTPSINGLRVNVPSTPISGCGFTISSMTLEWQNRSNTVESGSVAMQNNGSHYSAVIPFNTPGEVVQYKVLASYSNGFEESKPLNNAAPWFEEFIGITTVISCENFDTDPFLGDWTHALTSGTVQEGADDWQWSLPIGNSSNFDPTYAHTGTHVIGNDLGADDYNGFYQPDKVNEAVSPVFDVSGYEHVRLQYRRWLNVEDGFYDQATIYANDVSVWSNFVSAEENGANVHHKDKEWRFHDVDLTSQVVNDEIQVKFELASDNSLNFGGWTIDDVCIVGYDGTPLSDVIFVDGFD